MKKRGVSLIEVIVSVSIFVILMITSLQIFKIVLDGQRQAAATSNIQESLKYFFEVISKEIRMAQINETGDSCNVSNGHLYNILNDKLYLKNYHGECVVYELVDDSGVGRFQITRQEQSAFLSPAKISITDLRFTVRQADDIQAMVTISLSAQAQSGHDQVVEMDLQSTISSRYYK
jgi:prepilin-type N-terminal cleavage/methylation domain-containing protein